MSEKKRIVGVRKDTKGVITHVKFAGNSRVTPVDRAVPMAQRGEIENVHDVNGEFLRSDPDEKKRNNLDELPGV